MKTATRPSAPVDPLIVGGMRLRTADVLKKLGRLSGRSSAALDVLSELHAELNSLVGDAARMLSARTA